MTKRSIIVVGLGTLGSAVLLQLNKEVDEIILIDRDIVEEKNLTVQKLYAKDDVGSPKAEVAAARLRENGFLGMITVNSTELTGKNVDTLLSRGVIMDCTDNFLARHVINEWCKKNKRQWVHGAAVGTTGVVMPFTGNVCFNCVYQGKGSGEGCDTAGIELETAERVAGEQLRLAMLIMKGGSVPCEMVRINEIEIQRLKLSPLETCSVCNGSYPHLRIDEARLLMLCGDLFQAKLEISYGDAKILLQKHHTIRSFGDAFSGGPYTVFRDGRVLIKATNETDARELLETLKDSENRVYTVSSEKNQEISD